MGKYCWAALIALWLGIGPLTAAAEDYQALCDQGKRLVSEFKLEKANGKTPNYSEKDKAYRAGDLFTVAAAAAPDELLKYQAYMLAGEAYSQAYTLKSEAADSYKKARELGSVSGELRGVAAWDAARHTRKTEDYEYILSIPGAASPQRADALEALASQLLPSAKDDPSLYLKSTTGSASGRGDRSALQTAVVVAVGAEQ